MAGGGDDLKLDDFIGRASSIKSFNELKSLRDASVSTENVYRGLFARSRDSWEIPEVDDPYVFLVKTFEVPQCYKLLPQFNDDPFPRCFKPVDDQEKKEKEEKLQKLLESEIIPLAIVQTKSEFELSWECLTENQLRFVNWNNMFAAGGAVAGCLAPLPKEVADATSEAKRRVQRRKYLHDTFLPGSDIDIFLYGLSQEEAEEKLIEIYEAVQAVNPYEIRVFRSAHALTLVSRYPFRHIQIVLRLYNSPAEILMGFDVDSCAVGYDGKDVYTCPRTALAFSSQTNVVDMSRRSPSYEMRLAKYAQRGFEVVVPGLDRSRVDPFLYEKRFEHTKGLARLLLLERLRTPEDRLRYRIEAKIKREKASGKLRNEWRIRHDMNRALQDARNLDRAEGTDGPFVPQNEAKAASEMSNYSTVFLPWGPNWTADRIEKQMRKKDKILNKIQFLPGGRVVANRRGYKIHVCAVGSMAEVIADPYPDDPPIPDDAPEELLEGTVSGRLSWLLDNPGRQQIGSFHPITEDDWMAEAFISTSALKLIEVVLKNDGPALKEMLDNADDPSAMLNKRDFMGRTVLHFCALLRKESSNDAAEAILSHSGVNGELLNARLANGRTALHLAAMRGNSVFVEKFLKARDRVAKSLCESSMDDEDDDALEKALLEVVDIDGSDWEHKLSPLHYAVVMGHQNVVEVMLNHTHKANARKVAVHKDMNQSLSLLHLLCMYASEITSEDREKKVRPLLSLLLKAGASMVQVDKTNSTLWHRLVSYDKDNATGVLEMFLDATANEANQALDLLDNQGRTALFIATYNGNARAVKALLAAGAKPEFEPDEWNNRCRQAADFLGHQLYFHSMHKEYYRCPISLASKAADVPCLEAFLESRAQLANSIVDLSSPNQRSRFGATMGFGAPPVPPFMGGMQSAVLSNQDMRRKPLDILCETHDAAVKSQSKPSHEASDIQGALMKKKCDAISALLKAAEKGSYQEQVWAVVTFKEKEAMEAHQKNMKERQSLSPEELQKEKDSIAQMQLAKSILVNSGGERLHEIQNNDEDPQAKRGRYDEPQVVLPDPFVHFVELQPYDFPERVAGNGNNFNYGSQHAQSGLSKTEKDHALQLMCAAASGDAEEAKRISNNIAVCFADMLNATPFFVAIRKGHLDLARAIFDVATTQFELFVTKEETKMKREASEEKALETDGPDTLKGQLRHLNNMDIASGTGPAKKGKNPDQMRLELERAEAAATAQISEAKENKEIASPVSPAALLLQRCLVLSEEKVSDFKKALSSRGIRRCGWSKKDDPVLLNPMEFAIVSEDTALLKFVIDLAESIKEGSNVQQEKRDDNGMEVDESIGVDNSVDVNEADEESEEEEVYDDDEEDFGSDEEYDEYMSDDIDEYGVEQTGKTGKSKIKVITRAQLRFLYAGQSTRNSSLGNLSLLELAVATDNLKVLELVLTYSKHFGLPRGAIGLWKRSVDKKFAPTLDDQGKKARQQQTDLILSQGAFTDYRNQTAAWIGENRRGAGSLFPSLLQTSLALHAESISNALLDGTLNELCLKCVFDNSPDREKLYAPQYKYLAGASAALAFIKEQLKSDTTLDKLPLLLVGPMAVDSLGRSSLFYAPAPLIAKTAGVGKVHAAGKDFLDVIPEEAKVSPLLAAICAYETDRVAALFDAGCSWSKACPPKWWGPVHMAIKCKDAVLEDDFPEELRNDRWGLVCNMMDIIISKIPTEDKIRVLNGPPEAEHTPLMLALQSRADQKVIAYFLEKANGAEDVLSAKDYNLNSLLHHAVETLSGASRSRIIEKNETIVGCVNTLLSATNESSKTLAPNSENSDGVTPSEIALDAATFVWNRAPDENKNRSRRQDGLRGQYDYKRQNLGKGPLPPPPTPQGVLEDSALFVREVTDALSLKEGQTDSARYITTLEEVQESRENLKKRMKQSRDQLAPKGPPSIP